MSIQYTPYALLSLASAAALAALAALAWGRRDSPGAKAFAALMLAGGWWKLAHALGLASAGLDAKLFWAKAEYLGAGFVPLAWLALALGYAGVWDRPGRRRLLTLLAVVPLATLALAWTNAPHGEPHGLVWGSAALDRSGPFVALDLHHGPWYWAQLAYCYALSLAGTAVLVSGMVRSSRLLHPQGLALLAGALLTWLANALHVLGASPVPNLNPGVLVFPITGALFALGLFRFRLLDLAPVARGAAFGASRDGLVVADPKGRLVDANPAAEGILGRPAHRLLGTSVSALIPARFPPLDASRPAGGADRQEVSLTGPEKGSSLRYELTQAPLDDADGRRLGRLVSLRDVTERRRAEEALAGSEGRFRALVQNVSDVVTVLDADGAVRYASPASERVLGYEPGERIGRTPAENIHPEDLERVARAFDAAGDGVTPTVGYRYRRKDGGWVHLESVVNNLLSDPSVGGVVINTRDVTGRKEAEARLQEAEERYRTLVEEVPAITYVHAQRPGERSTARYASPQIELILGCTPEEYAGDPGFWEGIIHPEDRKRIIAADVGTGQTGEPFREEFRAVRKDGRVVWLREEGNLVRTEPDGTQVWHGVMFDITELKRLEGELARQATHDPLTGLPNRRLLVDRLGNALERAQRRGSEVAVLFVDLDNFKIVNDSLGHEAGDRMLVGVAGRLRSLLRLGDTAARLGGDEFVVLLEDVAGAGEATRVAGRIGEALGEPFDLGGHEAFAAASVGVVLGGPSSGRGPGDLLREADLAMYSAKHEGKAGYAVFEASMDESARGRLRLENDLRRALDRGEFRVHYQPVVLLRTGRIVGVEALLRWEHPERGLLTPGEFLPVAEETGMIVPVGRWVLREACRRAGEWHGLYPSDPPLIVGVNVSARQLRDPHLVEGVGGALREAGLDPAWLTLEITEGAFVEDEGRAVGSLKALRGLGVGIALDDFGTGYSSLSYLRRLPAGLLKIDGSFVRRIGEDPKDEVLVSGMVSIARGLGLGVLAEGVETPEQLARIEALGCDLAQGRLFSEPVPGETFGALLERPEPRL